jgi:hypothetical protein
VRRQRLTETSTWSTGFDGIQPNAMVQSSCKPSRFLSFMWPAELRSAHIFFFFYRIWIFQPCIWLNPYMYKIYMFLYSLISLLLWSIYEVTFFAFYWPLCHGRKWYHECFALSTCMFFFFCCCCCLRERRLTRSTTSIVPFPCINTHVLSSTTGCPHPHVGTCVFVTWKGERERSGRQAMLLTVGPDMFLLYEADRSGPWSLMIRLLLGPLDRAG